MAQAAGEVGRGWGVVLASAAGFGLGLSGLPFYTTGLFVEPLNQAFGWSATQVQAGLTVMLLCNMATLPAAGWLADRFGARIVAIVSVVLFALAFMSLATLDANLVRFYLTWAVISAAGAGTLAVVWSRAIGGWFQSGRGFALGLAMLGTGVTAMVGPPLANALIAGVGWRMAYVALGTAPLLVALPLVLWLFHERDGAVVGSREQGGVGPILRDGRFWLIGVAFLMVAIGVAGMIPNLVRLLTSHGYTRADAALTASLVGLFVICGRVGCGWLLDRFWAPAVAAGFFLLPAVACLLLRVDHIQPLVAGIGAAALGLAAGAEFDVMPYLISRYFGLARMGLALGMVSTFFYLGAAVGPLAIAGAVEVGGGYGHALLVVAALLTGGALSLLALGLYRAPVVAEGVS